jgi:hypothetical protein
MASLGNPFARSSDRCFVSCLPFLLFLFFRRFNDNLRIEIHAARSRPILSSYFYRPTLFNYWHRSLFNAPAFKANRSLGCFHNINGLDLPGLDLLGLYTSLNFYLTAFFILPFVYCLVFRIDPRIHFHFLLFPFSPRPSIYHK